METKKTLAEQINEIKDSFGRSYRHRKEMKKAIMVQVGLTDKQAELALFDIVKDETTVCRGSFSFGVEIECGVRRGAIAEAAEAVGADIRYEHYNHEDGKSYFKFVTDASVNARDLDGDGDPIECVSPVLKGTTGKNALKKVCDALKAARAGVNRSCGLHVHISVPRMTDRQYVNTFVNYQRMESLIDSFMAPSRKNNTYAMELRNRYLEGCTSKDDVNEALHYNRYYKVNPRAYDVHKTVEFRQHQGTTDYEKIAMWVAFCGKLVVWSAKNRLESNLANIEDVPFLNKQEKDYFAGRIAQFAGR